MEQRLLIQATYVLLQEQLSIMDVNDYTTLACERYVKRFTIEYVFEFSCKEQARRHCVPALLRPDLG